MSVIKQLYQLQEVDLQIESNGQTLKQNISQLGESPEVIKARTELSSCRQHLDELKHQQLSAEWEIDDLTSKVTTLEHKLYAGQIKNPKELANLQHETESLKVKRSQLEDKALEIMNQVELVESDVTTMNNKLQALEAEWQRQQQHLATEIKQLETTLSQLEQKRQLILAEIEPHIVDLYQDIKQQKGAAVARVDQGMCCGCRILLPSSELQRARSGSLVQCSSCRRILFFA